MSYKDEITPKLTKQQLVEITLAELKRRVKQFIIQSRIGQDDDYQNGVLSLTTCLNLIRSLQTDQENEIWETELEDFSERINALDRLAAISQELGLYD